MTVALVGSQQVGALSSDATDVLFGALVQICTRGQDKSSKASVGFPEKQEERTLLR